MRLIPALIALAAMMAPWSVAHARSWSARDLDDLLRVAAAATAEGLSPYASEIRQIDEGRAMSPWGGSPVDIRADNLFHALAKAYTAGVVDPTAVDANWLLPAPQSPDPAALDAAADAGVPIATILSSLLPQNPEYRALKAELARLAGSSADAARIAQVRANLERWRWLPRSWPADRIEVRIAEYRLIVFQSGTIRSTHNVMVGKPSTPTPVLLANGTGLTLNPPWDPPVDIARNELLPRFRANPAAAEREGYVAIKPSGVAMPQGAVDWRARSFPYRLRQLPGPANAMGKVVLRVDNPYAIYLHDTPAKSLFQQSERAFSHGCVRVENAMGFAAALTGANDTTALDAVVETGETTEIALAQPIPIYFLYLTAALADDGSVQYLKDVYKRDARLAAALDKTARAAASANPNGNCVRETR